MRWSARTGRSPPTSPSGSSRSNCGRGSRPSCSTCAGHGPAVGLSWRATAVARRRGRGPSDDARGAGRPGPPGPRRARRAGVRPRRVGGTAPRASSLGPRPRRRATAVARHDEPDSQPPVCPAQVEDDGREPRPQLDRDDPLRLVGGDGPIGADHRAICSGGLLRRRADPPRLRRAIEYSRSACAVGRRARTWRLVLGRWRVARRRPSPP